MPERDKAKLQVHYREVQEWMMQDFSTTDIVEQCMCKWGVSERTAWRYVAQARTMFEDVTKQKAAKRLAYHIARRQRMLRNISEEAKKTPAGISAELSILQDIAKLERLYKVELDPFSVEVESTSAKPGEEEETTSFKITLNL